MRTYTNSLVFMVVIICAIFKTCFAQTDSLVITSYYPSPMGVYSEVRLVPKGGASAPCGNTTEGLLFYDTNTRELRICRLNITTALYEWGPVVQSIQPTTTVTDVNGDLSINGDLNVNGSISANGPIQNNGDLTNNGNLSIVGSLSKGSGSFLIDHPLDPKNKILRHSFVESPDMKNIYDGIAILDDKGESVVQLPDYFAALNENYRYQLTSIGGYAPIYVKQEIIDNKFVISGGYPNLKVSWMITGIRKDAFASKNRIVVEEEKGLNNAYKKGDYVYPQAFLPKEK